MAQADLDDIEDFEEYIDFVEDVLENERLPKRYIRETENPFEKYRGDEFRSRYRFEEASQRENITKFWQIARFPGVAACIDCSHVPIASPGGDHAEVFRNRKGYFSLNVQVAAGPQMEILDIVVRYPGSTHDSVIFDRSALRIRFEQNQIHGLLLGDNGYPCTPYLLIPVIHPDTASENRYNTAHIRTRNIVERVFGIWKRRFPCLRRVLSVRLETSIAVICACAVLHNIAIQRRDSIEDIIIDDNIPIVNNNEHNELGLVFRREFINEHF